MKRTYRQMQETLKNYQKLGYQTNIKLNSSANLLEAAIEAAEDAWYDYAMDTAMEFSANELKQRLIALNLTPPPTGDHFELAQMLANAWVAA